MCIRDSTSLSQFINTGGTFRIELAPEAELTASVFTDADARTGMAETPDITELVGLFGLSITHTPAGETGAGSLNLSVAQQTVNSLRSTIGAELAGSIDAGWRDRLVLQLRLGWVHEYASVSRPVTASFAGAPGAAFTVFGAAPQRDAASLGFAANTLIAERTSLHFRYDGEVGTGTDNHAFSAGLRMTW